MATNIGSVYESQLLFLEFGEHVANEILALEFEFDCYLVIRDLKTALDKSDLIDAIAKRTRDWVEVFGPGSESIHDAIDLSSVNAKRQEKVGDGIPMTAWHDDVVTDTDIAAHILSGGLGCCDYKILVIIGSKLEERALVSEIAKLSKLDLS